MERENATASPPAKELKETPVRNSCLSLMINKVEEDIQLKKNYNCDKVDPISFNFFSEE